MRVRWSQNFLVDKNMVRRCADALDLRPDENVIEIGPGRGILTEALVAKAAKVTGIEIDPSLCEFLRQKFAGQTNFKLIHSDFLEIDFTKLSESKKIKLIGNLPYAVVSPILQKILKWRQWTTAVLMVQKEVGERILAPKDCKDYGILTISVQSQCRAEKVCIVSKSCFRPAPEVESMVLRLTPLAKPAFDPHNEAKFFRVVRAGFAHRRKTLLNSLMMALQLPAEQVRSALDRCGFPANIRGESLSISDFKRLSEIL